MRDFAVPTRLMFTSGAPEHRQWPRMITISDGRRTTGVLPNPLGFESLASVPVKLAFTAFGSLTVRDGGTVAFVRREGSTSS